MVRAGNKPLPMPVRIHFIYAYMHHQSTWVSVTETKKTFDSKLYRIYKKKHSHDIIAHYISQMGIVLPAQKDR